MRRSAENEKALRVRGTVAKHYGPKQDVSEDVGPLKFPKEDDNGKFHNPKTGKFTKRPKGLFV